MEFGSNTNVIVERLTPSLVNIYGAADLPCLEIGARPEFFDPDDDGQLVELGEHFDRTEMRAHSIHARFQDGFTIASEDHAVRSAAVEQAGWAARVIVALGGSVVVVHPGGPKAAVASIDELHDRIHENAPRIVASVVDEGARVAFENPMPSRYPDSPDALMQIVERFPSDEVGVCIDTGHANCSPWGAEFVRRAAGRILTTHMQDNDGTGDMHIMPGHGSIDWDEFMRAFRGAGYSGPWVFECGKVGLPVFDQAQASMELLRGAWDRAGS